MIRELRLLIPVSVARAILVRLLQTRTRVLSGELGQTFQRWYPSLKNNEEEMKLAASLPRVLADLKPTG